MITDTEIAALRDTLDRLGDGPALVHTSLIPLGISSGIAEHLELLKAVFAGRETFLPAFNYDYYKSRWFNPYTDTCWEVGCLNEYVRSAQPGLRSDTPIYSVVSLFDNPKMDMGATETPLGKGSVFEYVDRSKGIGAFWGAPFSSNTFLHYVEEIAQVGYRYPKRFDSVMHRVRPPGDIVEIDWERIEDDLAANGLLVSVPLGRGMLWAFRADRVMDYWIVRLRDEESYFLTRESCERVAELALRVGYPFTLEGVEG